jgi:hypothetical protein
MNTQQKLDNENIGMHLNSLIRIYNKFGLYCSPKDTNTTDGGIEWKYTPSAKARKARDSEEFVVNSLYLIANFNNPEMDNAILFFISLKNQPEVNLKKYKGFVVNDCIEFEKWTFAFGNDIVEITATNKFTDNQTQLQAA